MTRFGSISSVAVGGQRGERGGGLGVGRERARRRRRGVPRSAASILPSPTNSVGALSRRSAGGPGRPGCSSTSAPRRLAIQAMSSTVETKWCVAPCAGHRFAHLRQLGGARQRRVRREVLVDRGAAAGRPFGPDLGAAGRASVRSATPALSSAARSACAAARPITWPSTATVCPRATLPRQPVDVVGRPRRWGSSPARCRCRRSSASACDPVAAVGEQCGLVGVTTSVRHRAGEARQPLAAPASARAGTPTGAGRSRAPAARPGRGRQGVAHAFEAQRDRGGAGVHRQGLRLGRAGLVGAPSGFVMGSRILGDAFDARFTPGCARRRQAPCRRLRTSWMWLRSAYSSSA